MFKNFINRFLERIARHRHPIDEILVRLSQLTPFQKVKINVQHIEWHPDLVTHLRHQKRTDIPLFLKSRHLMLDEVFECLEQADIPNQKGPNQYSRVSPARQLHESNESRYPIVYGSGSRTDPFPTFPLVS